MLGHFCLYFCSSSSDCSNVKCYSSWGHFRKFSICFTRRLAADPVVPSVYLVAIGHFWRRLHFPQRHAFVLPPKCLARGPQHFHCFAAVSSQWLPFYCSSSSVGSDACGAAEFDADLYAVSFRAGGRDYLNEQQLCHWSSTRLRSPLAQLFYLFCHGLS